MDTEAQQTRHVLITGAASGIGREAALRFLRDGACVTALDLSEGALRALEHTAPQRNNLLTVRCDVRQDAAQAAAFQRHMARWKRLDVALLNAGVGETGDLFGKGSATDWQACLDVDLRAVLMGVHLAVRCMREGGGGGGAIVSVASAAGVFTLPNAPVYCAAKGGLVHFTRTAAPTLLARHGVRLAAVCPQFVDTAFLKQQPERERTALTGGAPLLRAAAVVDEIEALLRAPERNGVAAVMMQNGRKFDLEPLQPPVAPAARRAGPPLGWTRPALPDTYRRWEVQRLSREFAEAAALVATPLPAAPREGHVIVRRHVVGINASDTNFTSGMYHASAREAQNALPFTAGFESVGVVVRAAHGCGLDEGQAVATLTYGGFSEYAEVKARACTPVPRASPEAVAFLTSGLTASIALEEGGLKRGDTVLVTAAAGGTGMFAAQLAKLAGAHVIGTCSSAAKAALLRRLGVDRVVDYKRESLKEVLKAEYARGVDLVYEAVGGDMFKVAVDAVATKGRVLVIGMMSQYGAGWPTAQHPGLPEKLLKKSATLQGFFLPHYGSKQPRHLQKLFDLHDAGKLHAEIDSERFEGIEAVPAAIARLQGGRSFGKVVVHLAPPESGQRSKL